MMKRGHIFLPAHYNSHDDESFLIDKGKQMPMIVNNISRVPQLLQYYDDVSTLSNEPNIYSTNRIWSDMRGVFKRCIRMDRRGPCVFILSYRGWLVHWILPRWVGWVHTT